LKLAYGLGEGMHICHRLSNERSLLKRIFIISWWAYRHWFLWRAESSSLTRAVGFNKLQVSWFLWKLVENWWKN